VRKIKFHFQILSNLEDQTRRQNGATASCTWSVECLQQMKPVFTMDIQEFFIKGTGIVKSMKHSPF